MRSKKINFNFQKIFLKMILIFLHLFGKRSVKFYRKCNLQKMQFYTLIYNIKIYILKILYLFLPLLPLQNYELEIKNP